MIKNTASTRRSFLQSGALLVAPLSVVAAPAAVLANDELKTRLAKLENEAAIRELHQNWMRRINTGAGDAAMPRFTGTDGAKLDQAVCSIAADHTGQPDAIDVTADGKSAVGRYECAVEIESTLARDCTLAQMAHQQGGGFVRRTERRVLKVKYVKDSGAWTIAKVEFASV